MKRFAAVFLIVLVSATCGAAGMWLYIEKTDNLRIAVIDTQRLSGLREDYPDLAKKVVNQSTAQSPYDIVVAQGSLVWTHPKQKTQRQDLTDKILPQVKVLAEKSDYDPKNPPFTKEELEHAKQAMAALDEMNIAVGVGQNIFDYRERFTNTVSKSKPHMMEFPDGEIKTEMIEAWDAFGEAGEVWQDFSEQEFYWEVLKVSKTGRAIKKHGAKVSMENRGELERISSEDQEKVLQAIWNTASIHVQKATQLMQEKAAKQQS